MTLHDIAKLGADFVLNAIFCATCAGSNCVTSGVSLCERFVSAKGFLDHIDLPSSFLFKCRSANSSEMCSNKHAHSRSFLHRHTIIHSRVN